MLAVLRKRFLFNHLFLFWIIQFQMLAMFVTKVLKKVLKIRYIVFGSVIGGGLSFQKWKDSLSDLVWINDLFPKKKNFDALLGAMSFRHFKYDYNEDYSNKDKYGLEQKVNKLQSDLNQMHYKYKREVDRLESENRRLKLELYTCKNKCEVKKNKTLIDLYSEVLDDINNYNACSNFQYHDHLPKVVIVGDQSAGKTSVLEMITKAKIFPRVVGGKMTSWPVKVTVSNGPYHIGRFSDCDKEYDLTRENDVEELRSEIEMRMFKNMKLPMNFLPNNVISVNIKGPGFQDMVLVDLPGTVSPSDDDFDTREFVKSLFQSFLSNPNAVILCIQDGSFDSDGSETIELLSEIDPSGERTILVLTKVDLVAKISNDPDAKINTILHENLLPIKALNYFAVISGRGRKNDSIKDIHEYEQQFFNNNLEIFKDPSMKIHTTTENLSVATSDCFWKMVKKTIEQQADFYKAAHLNLKTEWKNSYPGSRELDRDELFEKARSEILDKMMRLREVSVKRWEELLIKKIWDKISDYVFDRIYLPSAHSGDTKMFNTSVDIKLRDWANEELPEHCVEVGWEVLKDEFSDLMLNAKGNNNDDDLFYALKDTVVKDIICKHAWESKANDVLRVIQMNTLEDRCIQERNQWVSAVKFIQSSIKEKLSAVDNELQSNVGPGTMEQWIHWKYPTEEQTKKYKVKSVLENILCRDKEHSHILNPNELNEIQRSLESNYIIVEVDDICKIWEVVYKRHFLKNHLCIVSDNEKRFYQYLAGLDVECSDVILFWRIEQMLKVTANTLRLQIMNREIQNLDKEIEEVLEEYQRDPEKKNKLFCGRKIELAEEIKRVKRIHLKLEEFIQVLNKNSNGII